MVKMLRFDEILMEIYGNPTKKGKLSENFM